MTINISKDERLQMLQRMACAVIIGVVVAFAMATTVERGQYLGAQVTFCASIAFLVWLFCDLGDYLIFPTTDSRFPVSKIRHIYMALAVIAARIFGELMIFPLLDFGNVRPQFNSFITWCVLDFAMVSGFLWLMTQKQIRNDDKRRESDMRLKLLEAQIEPHMLFNTLANLRALINTDPLQATKMLDHCVSFLRATLNGSRVPLHTIGTEFDRVGDYLDLMKIRMGQRLKYALDLPPELEDQLIPPFLLQPLVENAIKHGLEPKVEGGRVIVSARLSDGQIIIEVNDTGVGSDVEYVKESHGNGFGLKQVAERLQAVYGEYGKLVLFTTEDFKTSVQIKFPSMQQTKTFA